MTSHDDSLTSAARQDQFLEVIDRDEAWRRFASHLRLTPLGTETASLAEALDRVLAMDVLADVDVPAFDRSNVDGFAVRSADTVGGSEMAPRLLRLNAEVLSPGVVPREVVAAGTCTTLATGGVLPRGADAVLMVEFTDLVETSEGQRLRITRAVSPGEHVSFAGTDIACGETVLRSGKVLTSREIGVLAAIGRSSVSVFRRPRVAIISTGSELVSPGGALPAGAVFDSNAAILAASVRELGGDPVSLGIVPDDESRLDEALARGMDCDAVVLSGGTSKGAGDLSYRVVSRLTNPGIVAHGVALKPGKPICLAVTNGMPVVILPGFPTSAIFTFHEFVAPVLRAFSGRPARRAETLQARLPVRVNSDRGRTEYLLVGLVRGDDGLVAFPMGKGSGSVTTYSNADGFITIGQQTEIVEADSNLIVQRLGEHLEPADLVVIGSHCLGLEVLLRRLQREGVSVKAMHVGSQGGLTAAKRGQCDIAGIHLFDAATGEYNRPFLSTELELIRGYRRSQGLVHRPDDPRFRGITNIDEAIAAALRDPDCTMVNRNAGSGTRVLVDRLLGAARPPGYAVQTKSHNAVAAAVRQGRADWGLAINTVTQMYGLAFVPYQPEHYDFVIPRSRFDRPPVRRFRELLNDSAVATELRRLGFDR
jgi:putative molybdopterin biosynthesis protein